MGNVLVETLIIGWPLFRDISPFKAYRTFPASDTIQGLIRANLPKSVFQRLSEVFT